MVEAASVASRVREIRENIHAHPELRFQEFRTSEICAVELEAFGIEVRRGVGGTGVVGLLRGSNRSLDGRTIGFRAEMDALAMDDLCNRPYAYTAPGVAHLCGHDGHVAALLGTAMVLSRLRENLNGNVKFFFEPAEESGVLDDVSGAARMIADGALNDPRPNAIFGGHFYPDWPADSIALRSGASFSGNDTMKLTVIGRESHSAMPNTGIDAIVVAAHVITAMQSMAARETDVGEAASFTIGTIRGGRAANLLAERVEMNATIRISDEDHRDSLPAKLERVVKGVCDAFGANYELEYKLRNLPPVVSTMSEVKIMSSAVKEVLGDD